MVWLFAIKIILLSNFNRKEKHLQLDYQWHYILWQKLTYHQQNRCIGSSEYSFLFKV